MGQCPPSTGSAGTPETQSRWLPWGFHYRGQGKDLAPSFLDPRGSHPRPWDFSSSGRARERWPRVLGYLGSSVLHDPASLVDDREYG